MNPQTNSLQRTKILIGCTIVLPIIIIIGLVLTMNGRDNIATDKGMGRIYNDCNSTLLPCAGSDDIQFVEGEFEGSPIRVKVEGTIYRNVGNITVYASCTDDLGHGLDSNATVVIYDKNNATFVNWANMSTFGGFNHKYIGPVPESDGNYYVMVNCTSGSEWGLGYAEFQVPDWLLTLLNSTNHSVGDITVIINNTNTTTIWLNKIMEYWGIKTYTCLNILNDAPTISDRGQTWEIRTQVIDEYGTAQSNADVWCNITTNFWGVKSMTYSAVTAKFIYFNYLNNSGTLTYNVTCEEIGYESQSTC